MTIENISKFLLMESRAVDELREGAGEAIVIWLPFPGDFKREYVKLTSLKLVNENDEQVPSLFYPVYNICTR